MASYRHTQKAPLCLLLYATALGFAVAAWIARDEGPVAVSSVVCAALLFLVGLSFQQLTISSEDDRLSIRFGPLPLFRRSVTYADIVKAEPDRTTILDGLGIHYSVRGGWVWNLWGRDCVAIELKKGKLWLGTDDAKALAEFLNERVTALSMQAG